MKYNRELKTIDTEAKAYLLGFLYGDGCISEYKEKSGRIRFLTRLSIHIQDKDIVDKLHKNFPFFNKMLFNFKKYNEKCGIQISLSKSSKELFFDLQNNGLMPRKSYENKNKLSIPNIAETLVPHFLRGFFDADGSVFTPKKRKNLIHAELCGVSKSLLFEVFKKIQITAPKDIISKFPSKGRQEIFIIRWFKNESLLKLKDYFYSNATIYCNRKFKIFDDFKIINKVLDRKLECPTCKSLNVWKNGIRPPSIRYECHDCNKNFSIKIQAHCKSGELLE